MEEKGTGGDGERKDEDRATPGHQHVTRSSFISRVSVSFYAFLGSKVGGDRWVKWRNCVLRKISVGASS